MLHLAVIGIVCAVSAPIEDTAFINRKNNASNVFSHFDGGEKKIVPLPGDYDVVAHNFSECAGQKITNRTSSFFYEYIIKQYRDNKNSSCSIMESVSARKKKKFTPNLSVRYRRKRNLLSPKTLRPPLDFRYIPSDPEQSPQSNTSFSCYRDTKSGLNCNEKKIFFRLIRPRLGRKRKTCKGCKRHLDRLKVDDELDLNKRIEKLVKEIALENQRKENSAKELTKSHGIHDDYVELEGKPSSEKPSSFPFFNHIKKIFSFSKNYFNNKVNSVPIDSEKGKVLFSDKAAHISSYDLLKTMRKTTRFRRNPHVNHIPYRYSGNTVYKNEFIEKSCPHSAHFKGKRHFKRRRTSRRVIDGRRKRRRHRNMKKRKVKRRGKKVKNWPLFKNYPGHDLRLRRHRRKTTLNSNEISATETPEKSTDTEDSRNEFPFNEGLRNEGETESNDNESNEESSLLLTTSENVAEDTTASVLDFVSDSDLDKTGVDVPQTTLEKPFLQRDDDSERTLHATYNPELPFSSAPDFLLTPKYKYDLPNEKYLTPDRYLQIRHALRSYLVHNKVFTPVKRKITLGRKKRCGKSDRCRKCWRSPPLLCIPYIRKGQEDQLKYFIRIMQSMIGKPFSDKADIFERTKYKPNPRRRNENCYDYGNGDDSYDYPSQQNFCSKIVANTNALPLTSVTPQFLAPNPHQGLPPHCTPPTCPWNAGPPMPYPSATCPPVTCPPATCPPVICPPVNSPPANYPPANCPPATCRPVICPPATYPPATYPPVTCPPATCPPATCPPVTRPPATCPPATYPPATCRPATCPSGTCPPAASPPASGPSVTCPPIYPPMAWPSVTCPPVPAYVSPSAANSQQPCKSCTPMGSKMEHGGQERSSTVKMHAEIPISFPALGSRADRSSNCDSRDSGTTQPLLPTGQSGVTPAGDFAYAPENATAENSLPEETPLPVREPSYKTSLPPDFDSCQASDPPFEQKVYFSYSAYSFNNGQDCVTETYKYSEKLTSPGLPTPPPPFPLCNANQKYCSPRTVCEDCYTMRYMSPPTNAPPPSENPEESSGTQKFQPPFLRSVEGYRNQPYPEYHPGTVYVRKEPRKSFNDHQNMGPQKTEIEPPMYEDRFNPPTEPNPHYGQMKYEIAQNRLFRMRHNGNPKRNLKNDNDFYDEYPRPLDGKFTLHPRIRGSFNEYGQKNKKIEKRGKLIRHKRGDDYYSWPEGPENYNDYLDDPNYGDEYHRGMAALNVENSDTWTPPSYDMFSELAKAVTPPTVVVNISTTVSDEDGHRKTEQLSGNSSKTATTERTPSKDNSLKDSTNTFQTTAPKTTSNTLSYVSDLSNKGLNPGTTPDPDSGWVPDDTYDDPEYKKKKKVVVKPDSKKLIESTKVDDSTTESCCGQSDVTKRRKSNKKNMKAIVAAEDGKDVPKRLTTRRSKETDGNQDSSDEGQTPTTLKMASIAKGQKKLATKPCAKAYTKVYPESYDCDPETNETTPSTEPTKGTTTLIGKTTPLRTSTSAMDLKLQILAVCEGYLEVIKLIKSQNQTPAEALDMDLSRYCENVISQSFNCDSQKSRRPDFVSQTGKTDDNSLKPNSDTGYGNDFFDDDIPDTTDDYIDDLETADTVKQKDSEVKKNGNNVNNLVASVTENVSETKKPKSGKKKRKKKKKKKKKKRGKTHFSLKRQEEEEEQQQQQPQQITEDGEDLSTTGVTQEQVELIKLLKERKSALLSWLLNTRDHDKASDMQETEYFDDEDFMESDIPQDSGTVKPKRDENTSGATENKLSFVNESIFPIYAKQYGYDSGGEVREVEVLWRKVNEKTHEKKIYKNVSVLALLLSSTNAPSANLEDTKLVGSNGDENDDIFDIESKRENCKTEKSSTTAGKVLHAAENVSASGETKPPGKNATRTVITKPDVSCIVGKAPKSNETRQNSTHKKSHRFDAAKDLFQEYSIEFLDYAVYILPVMFTILFLFCCLCCAVHIFQVGKGLKKKKKKKKITISSDDTTETTEESEFESKKRKRRRKSKEGSDGILDSRRAKKFWNVLKLQNPKGSDAVEGSQTEKKRSFLRFLKCKRSEDKTESCCRIPLCEVAEISKNSQDTSEGKHCHSQDSDEKPRGRKKEEEKHKPCEEDEAAERRELIALLEELKKIEMEHTEDRKEVKSVQVQYMSQEDENVFQRPDFPYPYEKNVFGLPKGYSFCSKQLPFHEAEPPAARGYELYEDMNELRELLPCECSFYSKRNDYCDFRINHEGRCKRFLNVFRDSGVSRCKHFLDKICRKHESENRTFIFNKYRRIDSEEGDGFLGVRYKNAGTEVRFMENASPFQFVPQSNADLVEEMDNFTHQLNVQQNVRLKDEGVLCRL